MKKTNTYLSLGLAFSVSILCAAYLPVSEFVSGMISLPGIGALSYAIFQIARDAAKFEREQHLQSDEQVFKIGATSHMATVAFDKHVEFCEEYLSEVHQTIRILFREGPTERASECAHKLFALRRKYAAWIPKRVGIKLDPFENALQEIGVNTHLVQALSQAEGEARSRAITESYDTFRQVMGISSLNNQPDQRKEEIAIENVMEEIRNILGINELVEIRNFIINKSVEFTRKSK